VVSFPAGAAALRAGVGDDFAFALAATANRGIDEAAEEALLDAPYLP
jgi:hypothetical protein